MDVRQLREQTGLSLQQLAAGTGIPKDRIAKWEQGKGSPKVADSRILEKYFKEVVPHETGTTETPQNGHNSGTHPTLTEIGELVKKIQYVTNMTIEQIADRIKFSRPHLTTLTKSGESKKALARLKETFATELAAAPELTTTTNKPAYDVKPSNGSQSDKDVTIKNLSETTKSQQELLSEMSGKLMSLVTKVIEKL